MADGLIAPSVSLKAGSTRINAGNSWCSAALASSCLILIVHVLQQHSSELLHVCRYGKKWTTDVHRNDSHCYFCLVLCISNAYFRCEPYAVGIYRHAEALLSLTFRYGQFQVMREVTPT